MNIKSLFKKYIVPHEIDFIEILQQQSQATHKMIEDLYDCFIHEKETSCDSIIEDEHNTERIKEKNMHTMLNAFITPIDRESIYRAITQLNWVSISVKHFVQETKAYEIDRLPQYKEIFDLIYDSSKNLKEGFDFLSEPNHAKVARKADKTRNLGDKISQAYIKEMVELTKSDDIKYMFIHKEILSQLKEIGKRLHVSANTLQDIVIKMD
ncbi:MAG: hypothetical protein RL113_23 [Pseudomonadota bacterium]